MRTAVILFNLGGPDSLTSVKPFLENLFSDSAILNLPQFIRLPLAKAIASKREKEARDIYALLGGKSPLLGNTQAQAEALTHALGKAFRCFVCMRYWHPLTAEVVAEVKAYQPDQLILLPLYPQFSTTTTGSSFKEWQQECRRQNFYAPTLEIPYYPTQEGFVSAVADLTLKSMATLKVRHNLRVLFTAHGLPQSVIDKGDPYQDQVEQSVESVVTKMGLLNEYVLSYQSRVGPTKWLRPYTDEEIKRAGREGKSLVVVPISFVSEHSETLVELDRQYKKLAEDSGVHKYIRVPTVSVHPRFIKGLRDLVVETMGSISPVLSDIPELLRL